MAFSTNGLTHLPLGGSGGSSLFHYITTDTIATVVASGYFNAASGIMKIGDIVFVVVVNAVAPPSWTSQSDYAQIYVSGNSSGVVTTAAQPVDIGSPLVVGSTSLTEAELGVLDGVTAATVTASKAVVVGANKEIDTLVIADSGLKLGSGAGTAVTATAAELNRTSDVSARLVTLNATSLTVTEALHADRIVLMSHTAAASTATLPAATGTGNKYTFVVGAVNTNNHIIKVADATDVMYGNVWTNSTADTPDLGQPWPTAVDSDTITLNGTTTGGLAKGDIIELIDIATNEWLVRGFTTSNGSEATPFSATV